MVLTDLNLLDEALGLRNQKDKPWPLCGRFVLVEDCVDTSGAFVLHHIIKRSLTSHPSSSLIFLALSHPFSHYDRILRKLGCNLAAPRDNGRFSFIDMLMLQCPGEKIRMAYLAYVSLSKKSQNHAGLAAIFEKIERVISTLHPDNKKFVTVMIDDISLLEVAANGSSNDVLDFLHYCHTLTSEYGFAFVALDHKDIYLNEERPALILEVEFLADILVNAEPLATGLAKDVHGQVKLREPAVPIFLPLVALRQPVTKLAFDVIYFNDQVNPATTVFLWQWDSGKDFSPFKESLGFRVSLVFFIDLGLKLRCQFAQEINFGFPNLKIKVLLSFYNVQE
ncbi:hypothetical protein RIF29_29658 [Crotalaria pallida]|uniref:Elongator complex protein 6 n=1 Tax=Crotalaria pallida TaxID=3830 RepID=A0AAN9EH36_CROPI